MSESAVTLRDVRLAAGLSQNDLAERMDTSAVYISQVETGARKASPKWLKRFADATGASVLTVLRSVGIISEPAIDEAELAQMIAAYPDLTQVFEYARLTGQRGLLEHLEHYAHLLIVELGAQGVDVGQPGSGVSPADSDAGG